jgi:hypothetical protein
MAVSAGIDMAPIAMPFDLGLGNVGDDMLVELAGGFEVAAAAGNRSRRDWERGSFLAVSVGLDGLDDEVEGV